MNSVTADDQFTCRRNIHMNERNRLPSHSLFLVLKIMIEKHVPSLLQRRPIQKGNLPFMENWGDFQRN